MKHPALGTAQAIRADARNLPLADNSVDLVVTSPPYFALRSYQDGGEHYAGQIGSEPTPAEFVAALLDVTRECVRVLKPSGSLWVNLGDKYSGAQAQNTLARKGDDSAATWRQTDPKRIGIPNKSLCGIPWRYALACIDDLGLILRAEVIWSKPNGLPESVTDRVRRSHEQWFHFTLEPRYFSAVDEIREASQQERPQTRRAQALAAKHGLTEAHREALKARGLGDVGRGAATQDGTGKNTAEVIRLAGEADDALGGYAREFLLGGPALGKLPGSVWQIPTEPLRVPDHLGIDHFAAFPTEWPRRIISGWSPAGVCVACGEGRRPVTSAEYEHVNFTAHTKSRAGNQIDGAHRTQATTAVSRKIVTITGQECACGTFTNEEIECAPHGSTAPFTPAPTRVTSTISPTASAQSAPTTPLTSRTPPPTRPAVVLDPFGGTGTTALVAKALGRHGISVDMSADYCRLAAWRTNDRDQLAKVLGIEKAGPVDEAQDDLLGLIEETA